MSGVASIKDADEDESDDDSNRQPAGNMSHARTQARTHEHTQFVKID